MYRHIIKPILFSLTIEQAHHVVMLLLRIIGVIPGGRWLLRKCCAVKHPALEREVFGVKFPNPIGIAAGVDKDAEVSNELSPMGYGFVEIGTVTPRPQPGNPRPRLFRLPEDMAIINRMGFNNQGMYNAIGNLRHRKRGTIVGANIGKNTLTPIEEAPADYLKLFRNLYQYVDYFVVNFSCTNVSNVTSLQNKRSVTQILEPLFEFRRGQSQYRPILLKISPDLDDRSVDDMTDVMIETQLDGIVATNGTRTRERRTCKVNGRTVRPARRHLLEGQAVLEVGGNAKAEVRDIAEARGQTLAELALSWTLKDRVVSSVIIGASSSEQILENIKVNPDFTAEELSAIEAICKA